MELNHLTSIQLKNMVIAGAHHVINKQDYLNQINVFPVPDGDTGSNMAAAFESIAEKLHELPDTTSLSELCHHIADAALNGSRGNSGTILAQFFQGFYEGIEMQEIITLEIFANSMEIAAHSAHEAISNPVEGTIITVMHDWARWIKSQWQYHSTFSSLMQASLSAAKDSLLNTANQLKVLAKNHVVDAGAQGFVYCLEGMVSYLTTHLIPPINIEFNQSSDFLENTENVITDEETTKHLRLTPHAKHHGDLDHQYCTECIIYGDNLHLKQIKEKLSRWGSSFVIVGGKSKIKIHIHTNAPDKVFRDANSFGELLESKADDMWAQYRANINFHLNKSIAIITDSSCDLPQELIVKYNIITIPLQLIINQKAYLDKVNISSREFLDYLSSPKTKITTSQPTTSDIKTAFDSALRQSPSAVGIFLSEKISGTYRNILPIAKQYEEDIQLFDSHNTTAGLGLIVLEAAKAVQAGASLSSLQYIIRHSIANTTSYIALPTLKYAIRGGRVSKTSGFIAKLLRTLPILKLDASGKVKKVALGFGNHGTRKKLIKLVVNAAQPFKQCELIIAHVDCYEVAEKAKQELQKKFPHHTIPIVETTPVLAAHSGPGTLCISLLGK